MELGKSVAKLSKGPGGDKSGSEKSGKRPNGNKPGGEPANKMIRSKSPEWNDFIVLSKHTDREPIMVLMFHEKQEPTVEPMWMHEHAPNRRLLVGYSDLSAHHPVMSALLGKPKISDLDSGIYGTILSVDQTDRMWEHSELVSHCRLVGYM